MNADFWKIFWHIIGGLGLGMFASRFYVQWYATEKKKQVVVPLLFWWLSLVGTFLSLLYAVFYVKDSLVIAGYAFAWIPYVRNLIIHHRHKEAHLDCPTCGASCPPQAKFCSECGTRLAGEKLNAGI
jgi:lipid-A-disaccharide synthase-like uncharacterized protein